MTLPSKDSFATYGGVKFDFIDVVDPTTDRSATEMNVALASLSMMTRTCPKAIVTFGGTRTNPTIYYHEAIWGNSSDLKPTVTDGGSAGIYGIQWPPTVTDPLDEDHDLDIKAVWISCNYTGAVVICNANIEYSNSVVIYTADASGTLIDIGDEFRITVFIQ